MMNWKNSIKVFAHILIWAIVLLVPSYFMYREGTLDNRPFISYIIKVISFAVIFYFNYLYLIDKLLFTKRFILFILTNSILVIILALVQPLIMELIIPHTEHMFEDMRYRRRPPGPPLAMRFMSEYLLTIFIIGLSVAIKMTVRWYRDSINMEQVKSMQLEADLKNLRSQLNPHFLFNTLNNIYSLIPVEQGKAQESVHRLSGLLRYVLYENDEKFVPMKKELEFTKNYIDLMKLRISSNMNLKVLIENKDDNQDTIAPLMFMTLIENAFKHGTNNSNGGFIDIKILTEKGKGVLCTVENSLDDNNRPSDIEIRNSGIGLSNLEQRLKLLYPGKYQFETEKRTNSFFAMLRIDFNE